MEKVRLCVCHRLQGFFYGAAIFHDVGGLQDAGDDDHAAGAGLDDGGEIFELDAANAEDGNVDEFMHAADVVEADCRATRFGRRGKKRAEADVVGAFFLCSDRLGDAVGGFSDDGWRHLAGKGATGAPAGIGDGAVILPNMRALGADGGDDLGEVVDDEWDAGFFGDGDECFSERLDFVVGKVFSAELDDIDAALDHFGKGLRRGFAGDVAEIDDPVEVAIGDGFHGVFGSLFISDFWL